MTGVKRMLSGLGLGAAMTLSAMTAFPAVAQETIKVGILHSLSGTMATMMLENFRRDESQPSETLEIEPLTERERQVLELVVEGLTNAEIATQLYLSENTVKKYLRNILQKFHLNSRVEAAVYAVRAGIVEEH